MTDIELLDSRRFCSFVDEFAEKWNDADDEQREAFIDLMRQWLSGETVKAVASTVAPKRLPEKSVAITEPKRGGWPKGKPRTKKQQAVSGDSNKPMTASERALYVAQAMEAQANVRDQQSVVNDAVAQVIVPNWQKTPQTEGYKHFIVNANRHGEQVSFEGERWKTALTLHKIPCGDITFKPEGLAMSQDGATSKPNGQAWRVIIG